jgi:hypothetical protein
MILFLDTWLLNNIMWFDYTSGRCNKCHVLDYVRQQPPVYHPLDTFYDSVVDDPQIWSSLPYVGNFLWVSCTWSTDVARVNQQPPMHQLAVLSTEWDMFFHSTSDRIHPCWLLYFFFGVLFLAVFSLDRSSHIATLLTFLSS